MLGDARVVGQSVQSFNYKGISSGDLIYSMFTVINYNVLVENC